MKNISKVKLNEIEVLIKDFCMEFFDEELANYAFKLLRTVSRKSKLNIARGKVEIWAAAIVYVISRLNFLFDKDSRNFISVDELCDSFNVKKSTVSKKATQIENICQISFFDKRFTNPVIAKSFNFQMNPEGVIIPSATLSGKDIIIKEAEGDDL